MVPENIHTPPMEGVFALPLPPYCKFQFISILFIKNVCFCHPLPLGISIDLPQGRYGYFVELHNTLN